MEGGADDGTLSEIAIVGAGIAGTALAIACRQAGLAVRLYDRGTAPPEDDRLVEITANGTRVLQALGLRNRLLEQAQVPQQALVRSARTGFVLNQRPLGRFSESRYGAPCYLVSARGLRRMLRDAARSEGIPLESQVTITGVDTDTATLSLADGRRVSHQAVALATGRPAAHPNRTDLSGLLEPRAWQLPERLTLIRGRAERAAVDREHGRILNTWVGAGALVLERPVVETDGQPERVELTAVVRAERRDRTAAEALTDLLQGWHAHLRELSEGLDAHYVEVPVAEVADRWYAGRTALLGAMCHASPVYPELLPSVVLEDAWVLSRMMERWEDEPFQGFDEYERFRRPRARRLRDFARSELDMHTLTDQRACWQRNLKWTLSSRYLPEIALQQLDWVYGYDCIRGFA